MCDDVKIMKMKRRQRQFKDKSNDNDNELLKILKLSQKEMQFSCIQRD